MCSRLKRIMKTQRHRLDASLDIQLKILRRKIFNLREEETEKNSVKLVLKTVCWKEAANKKRKQIGRKWKVFEVYFVTKESKPRTCTSLIWVRINQMPIKQWQGRVMRFCLCETSAHIYKRNEIKTSVCSKLEIDLQSTCPNIVRDPFEPWNAPLSSRQELIIEIYATSIK